MNAKSEEQLNAYIDELKAKVETAEEKAQEATERANNLELQMKDNSWGWSVPRPMERNELPLPRLEMHWERDDVAGYSVRCTYMLVYEHYLGIKKIAGRGDPEVLGVPLGQTKRNGAPQKSFVEHHPFQNDLLQNTAQITVPNRDWSHAISDSKQLKLPLYITTCDGDVSVVDVANEAGKSTQRMLKVAGKDL